jgi:hypothetical protein
MKSVDALVSNTCGRKAVPVRPRLWVQSLDTMVSGLCCFHGCFTKIMNQVNLFFIRLGLGSDSGGYQPAIIFSPGL